MTPSIQNPKARWRVFTTVSFSFMSLCCRWRLWRLRDGADAPIDRRVDDPLVLRLPLGVESAHLSWRHRARRTVGRGKTLRSVHHSCAKSPPPAADAGSTFWMVFTGWNSFHPV